MKKKILILALLFLTTGCTLQNLNDKSTIDCARYVINSDINLYNVNNVGYRYYLPRGFNVINDMDYNEVLSSNGYKYYMYVDIISYYNEKEPEFEKDSNAYLSEKISNGDKSGYLEINKQNDKFFIEMMYNYAKIEVLVNENDIKESVTNISYILSSLRYNKSVIKNIIGEDSLNLKEKKYEIQKPKKASDAKNILDYAKEYDNYKDVNNELPDSDMIDSGATNEENVNTNSSDIDYN